MSGTIITNTIIISAGSISRVGSKSPFSNENLTCFFIRYLSIFPYLLRSTSFNCSCKVSITALGSASVEAISDKDTIMASFTVPQLVVTGSILPLESSSITTGRYGVAASTSGSVASVSMALICWSARVCFFSVS